MNLYPVGYINGGYMKYTIRTISQLGMALKSLRASAGLTQEEVAEKVGLLQKTISALESSSSQSTIESLMKLLAGLNCDIIIIPKDENIPEHKSEW